MTAIAPRVARLAAALAIATTALVATTASPAAAAPAVICGGDTGPRIVGPGGPGFPDTQSFRFCIAREGDQVRGAVVSLGRSGPPSIGYVTLYELFQPAFPPSAVEPLITRTQTPWASTSPGSHLFQVDYTYLSPISFTETASWRTNF
jgi:hypothetical protein